MPNANRSINRVRSFSQRFDESLFAKVTCEKIP